MRTGHIAGVVLILSASAMLALDVTGVFDNRRHPIAEVHVPKFQTAKYPLIEPDAAIEIIEKSSAITDFSVKVDILTDAVARSLVHYWPEPHVLDVDAVTRPAENWPLSLASWSSWLLHRTGLIERHYLYLERFDFRRALERGVGYCSQAALALHDVLREQGITSWVVGLDGHVVTVALTPAGGSVILDADYNVVLPFGLSEAERNPGAVAALYRGEGWSEAEAERIALIYGAEGNSHPATAAQYAPTIYALTWLTEILKWLVPGAMIIIGTILLVHDLGFLRSLRWRWSSP